MSAHLDEAEFVIFDTETTGLEPEAGDRVVEIAALRFKGNNRISTFQTLLNPKHPISPAAFAVNNISQEMLKDAPEAETMLPEFLEFIKGSCLCSYNAGFDLKFLNNELKLINREPLKGVQVVDILKMARRLLPGQERYALWFIARQLGIDTQQAHRAFSDVELTLGVFNKLKELLLSKGIFDFKSFSHLFSIDKSFLEDILIQRIAEIQEAINLGVNVKIKYLSSSGAEVTEREVVPKEIKQENGRSYLIGYCCLKREERTFRIDGILHLEAV
ncbi:MAG: exonuclease domain-containing protein [Candidatus Omnitrophota bacterium]|jgi:DNA polymerase III epsilon subunit family exonuclease